MMESCSNSSILLDNPCHWTLVYVFASGYAVYAYFSAELLVGSQSLTEMFPVTYILHVLMKKNLVADGFHLGHLFTCWLSFVLFAFVCLLLF